MKLPQIKRLSEDNRLSVGSKEDINNKSKFKMIKTEDGKDEEHLPDVTADYNVGERSMRKHKNQ